MEVAELLFAIFREQNPDAIASGRPGGVIDCRTGIDGRFDLVRIVSELRKRITA